MKKVLILFGGIGTEHVISCNSCKSVLENIDKNKYYYEVAGISKNNKWYKFGDDTSYLDSDNWNSANILEIDNVISYLKKFDIVFPIMHGNYCEDGKLQGFFESFNIKFIGSKTLSSAISMDKSISKLLFDSLNIPQVSYKIIKDEYKIDDIIKDINFPMIIKPANGGSSVGISKANNKKELIKSIKLAKKYDNKLVIEKFIKARELEVAVLENKNKLIISKAGEINSANEFYDYEAKYINSKSYTTIPDDLPLEVFSKIKLYAKKIFNTFDCKDLARIDFFYDEINNNIYINEINTIPGFTTISMFPKLIKNEGIEYKDLISILIDNALGSL